MDSHRLVTPKKNSCTALPPVASALPLLLLHPGDMSRGTHVISPVGGRGACQAPHPQGNTPDEASHDRRYRVNHNVGKAMSSIRRVNRNMKFEATTALLV